MLLYKDRYAARYTLLCFIRPFNITGMEASQMALISRGATLASPEIQAELPRQTLYGSANPGR